jgi:RNA polymerase sigma factor (sigma-70 family)
MLATMPAAADTPSVKVARPPARRPRVVQVQAEELDVDSGDLALRLRDGSPDALAEAYDRWASLVHTLALRSLGSHHDAEDVTQQVFVSAWRGRHTLQPERGNVAAWLVGITRHRIADHHAQRARARRDAEAVAAETPPMTHDQPPEDRLATRLLLADELERLGEPRAGIIRMAFVDELTHEEISHRLGMPLGTVKSHVRRGLLQLRNRIKEVGDATP